MNPGRSVLKSVGYMDGNSEMRDADWMIMDGDDRGPRDSGSAILESNPIKTIVILLGSLVVFFLLIRVMFLLG